MIARVWTGVVARENRDRYVAYVDSTGVDAYRQSPGCRLATILTRDLDGGRAEITAFSIWDDEPALQLFAGQDITAMVLYPEDRAFLLEPPQLRHHQVGEPGLHYSSGETS